MANPKEWGPLLWKIIHHCCEHLGKNTKPLLQADEINAYKIFVLRVGTVLPCIVCRKHFSSFYVKRKKDVTYGELKMYAKQYFYDLHEEVNKEKNIAPFGFENLSKYSAITKQELNELVKEFEKLFQKYIIYHYTTTKALNEFLLSLRMLRVYIEF